MSEKSPRKPTAKQTHPPEIITIPKLVLVVIIGMRIGIEIRTGYREWNEAHEGWRTVGTQCDIFPQDEPCRGVAR